MIDDLSRASGTPVVTWAHLPAAEAVQVGTKAAVLGRLADAGFRVPVGFVLTADAFRGDRLDPAAATELLAEARRLGGDRFAVRSSSMAEDRAEASFAGLYESVLDVAVTDLPAAVESCRHSARAPRVRDYLAARPSALSSVADAADPRGPGMAVLVQVMVDAVMAGVAFTADPVTGARDVTVINAVRGPGEPLVGGLRDGEEWTVRADRAVRTRASADSTHGSDGSGGGVMTARQARRVAALARAVEEVMGGPQDVEWAVDAQDRLQLLQARPITALPDQVDWTPPAPGHWMRTFRLGEWLPDPMTPLFADWLLPALEEAYLAGMRETAGAAVPFRYTAIHGWYYTAPPAVTPRLIARTLGTGRRRLLRLVFHAVIRVGRDPVAADRAVLGRLADQWRDELLPRYRSAVRAAQAEVPDATPAQLVAIIDGLADLAGRYLWSLAVVGGSAWKMEAALTRFTHRYLAAVLRGGTGPEGATAQQLLAGLPGISIDTPAHAVQSVDWYHPTAGDLGRQASTTGAGTRRRERTSDRRAQLEAACQAALAARPARARQFRDLLAIARKYAVLREQQSRDLTLAWPVLRRAALRLGEDLTRRGRLRQPDDVFFLAREELDLDPDPNPNPDPDPASEPAPEPVVAIEARRQAWHRQRRLSAPLTVGTGQHLAERAITAAVTAARGDLNGQASGDAAGAAVVGHPASPGRATGPVRLIAGPEDFAGLQAGDVLVARTTAPAWTPLFSRACAIVTDAGTLAAHASLIAREYGIPAVVGTGDATRRLRSGQLVTVDGSAGVVHTRPRRLPGRPETSSG